MKNYLIIILVLLYFNGFCQKNNLESIKLILPKGINADTEISEISMNKKLSRIYLKVNNYSVVYDLSTAKELSNRDTLIKKNIKAKKLSLNLIRPSNEKNKLTENVSIEEDYSIKKDSVKFCKEFSLIRYDNNIFLKNNNGLILTALTLKGLGNFDLYCCSYYKLKHFYFINVWSFGTIQNSVICIDTKKLRMIELTGLLLETTSIDNSENDFSWLITKDVEDFTEHGGNSIMNFNSLNPLLINSKIKSCYNPNYWNENELFLFYSSDYLNIILPTFVDKNNVRINVVNLNNELVFSSIFTLTEFKRISEININKDHTLCAISIGNGIESLIRTYKIFEKKISKINQFSVFEFTKIQWVSLNDLVVFDSYEYSNMNESDFYIIHDCEKMKKYRVSNVKGIKGYGVCDNENIFIASNSNILKYNFVRNSSEVILESKILKGIKDFIFNSKSNCFLLINEIDMCVDVYSLNSKRIIYKLFPLISQNLFIKLPNSPYYMCSKEASKMLHYVTPNLKVIGFDQLDPVYNRPDIVLDSIGNYLGKKDLGMINEYKKAWEKRIERLGLDKDKIGKGEFDIPDAVIENADNIEYENKEGKITIHIKANDINHSLNRYTILVNEVPICGSQGISLRNLNTRKWDTTVTVPLSIGENKIQVSVMNELGLENFKYPTYVNYVPKSNEITAKTFYIGIGVDNFNQETNNQKETQLDYCVKDVNDLAKLFGEDSNTIVKLYTNKQVNKENILSIKNFLKENTTENDRVIISCSSHGLLDNKNNFYLAMHDIDFDNPSDRGLAYEELENLLDGIPARKKLLLLDACNSGENELLDNKNKPTINSDKNNVASLVTARGAVKVEQSENNSFQKMNKLFINTRNKTGSVIISAAGGRQSALEGNAVKINDKPIENGAFTYAVMEYLKNNKSNAEKFTVNQLKKYVEERVVEITNGKQEPTSRQETMDIDWELK